MSGIRLECELATLTLRHSAPLVLYTMDQAKADKGMDRVTDVVHEQELDKERVTRVRRQRGQCSVLH